MIIEAIRSFNIDPKKSIIIGDKISDIEAGLRGGVQQRYFINKSNKSDDLISNTFKSLFDCAQYISNKEKGDNLIVSTFLLIISTILLFASFLSFSISVVDGYLLIAVMQCSSILLRYLIKDSSLQLFISSFLFPYSLGLLISANLFIKKILFFQEDILSNKYIKKTAIIISFLFL